MGYQADVTAYGAAGGLLLAVEVKCRRGSNAAWAAEVRRNLLVHRFFPPTPYFLLALPDRFYLWTHEAGSDPDAPPSYEVDPTELLSPYFEAAGVKLEDISAPAFQFIVSSLLHELAEGRQPNGRPAPRDPWLTDSGLLDALRGGRVTYEAVA